MQNQVQITKKPNKIKSWILKKTETSSLKELFWPRDFGMIMKLTTPIFIQVFITVIATLVASLSINWYKEIYHSDTNDTTGTYFYIAAKIILVFNLINFIPSLVTSGVLIICSNVIGQERREELPKIIWTGVVVNLIISLIFFVLMYFLAGVLLKAMGARDTKAIYDVNGSVLHKSELVFATQYLRNMLYWLFVYSAAQVFAAALQSIKKNNIAVIGAITGNFVGIAFLYMVLYIPKSGDTIMWASAYYVLSAFIQLCINFAFCYFLILKKYPTPIKQLFQWKYCWDTFKLGTPIALEYGVWTISQFLVSSAISNGELGDRYVALWRVIVVLSGFFSAFNTALGAVTNVLIGVEIGRNDLKRAYNLGWQLFMVGIYITIISGIVFLALTHPFFMLYKVDKDVIKTLGYAIVALTLAKILADVANLTFLRALWSASDIWVPILISIVTMMAVQVSIVYLIINVGYNKGQGSIKTASECFIWVFVGLISDPLLRSFIYTVRWTRKTWHKYIKQF
ncbi:MULTISPECIES: MATE family efflux transporter [unclassified Mycoplasma]